MKICRAILNLWSEHEIVNTQRAITLKVGKPELHVHVREREREREKRRKLYTSMATLYAGDIKRSKAYSVYHASLEF